MEYVSIGHRSDERAQVAAKLGGVIDERVWTILQREGYTETEDMPRFNELVAAARYYQKLLSTPTTPMVGTRVRRRQATPSDDWRLKAVALADVDAARAAALPAVMNFRRRILKNTMLSDDQARQFIHTRTRRARIVPGNRVLLAFPGSAWVKRVAVDRESVLGRLATLAAELERDYGWADYAAVWFILTGQTPLPWPIKIDDVYDEERLVAIQIAAAPWLPARVVLDTFLRLQRKVATVKSRPLSVRRLALIQFDTKTPTGSLRQRLTAWNNQFPRWAYSDRGNFRRDLNEARRQIQASAFRLDRAW